MIRVLHHRHWHCHLRCSVTAVLRMHAPSQALPSPSISTRFEVHLLDFYTVNSVEHRCEYALLHLSLSSSPRHLIPFFKFRILRTLIHSFSLFLSLSLSHSLRQDVRQFHLEVVAGRAERSPEYSLGSYVRTAVVRERGDLYNQSARIVKVRALLFCSTLLSHHLYAFL
jgi:hypothetical protein